MCACRLASRIRSLIGDQGRDNGQVSARVVDVPETANGVIVMGYGSQVALAAVGWMTLFSSTIAIAERWTDRAAQVKRRPPYDRPLPPLSNHSFDL